MTTKSSEIRSLTGARGLASLCVAIVHSAFAAPFWMYSWTFPDTAVDLFFCLSGFSLCLAYRAGSGSRLIFWPYLRARFARIYPLYAVCLFLMWWLVFRHLIGSVYYPIPFALRDAILQVPMLNSWPLIGSGSNWDFPAWSLSVELFCYVAVFPILFTAMPALGGWPESRRLCMVVGLAAISVFGFIHFWDGYLVSMHIYRPRPTAIWIPMIRGVTLFVAGVVIYSFWWQKNAVSVVAGQACDAVALGCIGILAGAFPTSLYKDFLTMLAPFLVLGLAANEKAFTSRLLAAQPFHWLGNISYSLYLLHVPVNFELHYVWPALKHWPVADFCMTMSTMLLAASFSFYCFEGPMRNWIKGRTPFQERRARS